MSRCHCETCDFLGIDDEDLDVAHCHHRGHELMLASGIGAEVVPALEPDDDIVAGIEESRSGNQHIEVLVLVGLSAQYLAGSTSDLHGGVIHEVFEYLSRTG